jgi:hypothetical protein
VLEYFPDPNPDELLYSVWARFGDQVQYQNRKDIVLELFGNSSYHAHVDWSYSLGHLVSQLPRGHDYTVDTLIDDHTLFPLYAPFLPRERRHLLRDQMITKNGTGFQHRLGMMISHIPHHKWLRYCPECVKNDRNRFGETYWHRLHQVSGVEICPVHATFLEDSTATRGSQKQAYHSAERVIQLMPPRSAITSPMYRFLKDIAECVDQLLHHTYDSPGLLFFQKQYFALLNQHGFITINGCLRVVEFLNALIEYYSPALLSLLHCGLSHTRHIEAEWSARLPYARKAQHPLHHILLIRFLGEEIETFLCSPIQPPRPFGDGPWPCLNQVCEHYRSLCITSYSVREKSSKDRPVGLFVCPSCNFMYSRTGPDRSPEDIFRRSGIPFYGRLWETKLHEWWLESGTSIECMARRLGVDSVTVKRQAERLALPPRPVSQRGGKSLDKQSDLEQRRKEWLEIMESYAEYPITSLLQQIKRAHTIYCWLKKHDQEWLCSHLPPKKTLQRTKAHIRTAFYSAIKNESKSQGKDRDVIASRAVRLLAQQLMDAPGEPTRVTPTQLKKALPSSWVLLRPNVFPLTVQAFQEVQETREAFALRRIQWALEKYQEESVLPTRREFILRAKARRVLDIPPVQAAIEEALTELAK